MSDEIANRRNEELSFGKVGKAKGLVRNRQFLPKTESQHQGQKGSARPQPGSPERVASLRAHHEFVERTLENRQPQKASSFLEGPQAVSRGVWRARLCPRALLTAF